MPNWKPDTKITCPPQRVLVIGPWDYNDEDVVTVWLDRFTVRMERPEIILTGGGTRVERAGEWVYLGVDFFAQRWAFKNWWDVMRVRADLLGKGKRGESLRDEEVLTLLGRDGYCLYITDGADEFQDLAEQVREQIIPSHFKVVQV